MKNADRSAAPQPLTSTVDGGLYNSSDYDTQSAGVTKREYFAAIAMHGLCANPEALEYTEHMAAERAVQHADALLEALEKSE